MSISTTQTAILTAAAEHPQGQLHWFPQGVRGGARIKVLGSMSKAGLIVVNGTGDTYCLTPTGYATIGKEVPDRAIDTAAVSASHPRSNTKQAEIIRLLSRPEGATLDDLTMATGWLKHTVRGALSQMSKKLGITINSHKPEWSVRVYRVAS